MTAYNKGLFVRDSIASVFNQEYKGEVELIIANDKSTDNSGFIIEEMIKKKPKNFIIKYFNHEENIGISKNSVFILKQVTGDFIAFCDADDIWTDTFKLQKQIEFLKNNNSFIGVATGNNLIDKDGTVIGSITELQHKKQVVVLTHFLQKNLITTSSVVIRNILNNHKDLAFIEKHGKLNDLSMWLICARLGAFYFIKEITTSYRVNVGIQSTMQSSNDVLLSIDLRKDFLKKYDMKVVSKWYFLKALGFYKINYAKRLKAEGKVLKSWQTIIFSILLILINKLSANNLQNISIYEVFKILLFNSNRRISN
jgi:glycosyltransferase involved in cell wall biosynthesis